MTSKNQKSIFSVLIRCDISLQKMWRSLILMTLFFFMGFVCLAQKENKLIREGNKLYDRQKYKDAEMNYRKALDLDKGSTKGQFNLGAATYQEKNYEEAAKMFNAIADSKTDKKIQADALHNLGNSMLESKQYEKSIQAYENSLIKNPSDKDTKYNLEYAKMMLKKEQQQQKDQDKQNKDQQKKDKQKQDQNKDQQKNDQTQNKNPQDQNKKISKEDAERLLEALKNDEKKTLAKLNKEKAHANQQVVIEKDW
jgi:Ca-activated chloride channel homolog